jgi:hypothetical protein
LDGPGEDAPIRLKTFYWCQGAGEQQQKTTLGTGDDATALTFIGAIETASGRAGLRRIAVSLVLGALVVAGVSVWGSARLTAAIAAPSEVQASAMGWVPRAELHPAVQPPAPTGEIAPGADALAGLQQQAEHPQGAPGPQFRPIEN